MSVVVPSPRVDGFDAARAVAILAMIEAHTNPGLGPLDLMVEYTAAPLFAVLMGVGLAWSRQRGSRRDLLIGAMVRGLVLIALGVALEQLGAPVVVVLVPLGLATIITGAVLAASRDLSEGVALTLWATTPGLAQSAMARASNSNPVGSWLLETTFYGTAYRVTTFVALAALGASLAWLATASVRRISLVTAVAVSVLAVIAFGQWADLWDATAYGWDRASVASTAAIATIIITVCLLAGRASPQLIRGLAVPGAMALTIYVLHVATMAWYLRINPGWPVNAPLMWLISTLAAIALPWGWWAIVGPGRWRRGPIEGAVDGVVAAARR
ncbi:hypothetical protein [Janibacter sp. GXQ6167]|uniref:hypothetical protein n=1 Tax=Janibacter sp. GXQ6167 TaxID=3240791 RepID=UPI0035245E31